MNPPVLYPTLPRDLACPSRFARTLRREPVPAPFLSTVLGKQVHQRIAQALRAGRPVAQSAFPLPRRVLLFESETLEGLTSRAHRALTRFEQTYRPQLQGPLQVEVRLQHAVEGHLLVGRLDLLTPGMIWDWKTGSPQDSEAQLSLYLVLARAKGLAVREARAVGLGDGTERRVAWSDGILPWARRWVRLTHEQLRRALAHPDALNPGPACRYCPYAHACPAAQAPARWVVDTHSGTRRPVTEITRPQQPFG